MTIYELRQHINNMKEMPTCFVLGIPIHYKDSIKVIEKYKITTENLDDDYIEALVQLDKEFIDCLDV